MANVGDIARIRLSGRFSGRQANVSILRKSGNRYTGEVIDGPAEILGNRVSFSPAKIVSAGPINNTIVNLTALALVGLVGYGIYALYFRPASG